MGEKWIRKGLEDKCISSILINPINPQKIYVSTIMGKEDGKDFLGGIYKSSDGGNRWEE